MREDARPGPSSIAARPTPSASFGVSDLEPPGDPDDVVPDAPDGGTVRIAFAGAEAAGAPAGVTPVAAKEQKKGGSKKGKK
jgi:hypothetical protein